MVVIYNKLHQKKAYAQMSWKMQNSSFATMNTLCNEMKDQCHVIITYVTLIALGLHNYSINNGLKY